MHCDVIAERLRPHVRLPVPLWGLICSGEGLIIQQNTLPVCIMWAGRRLLLTQLYSFLDNRINGIVLRIRFTLLSEQACGLKSCR